MYNYIYFHLLTAAAAGCEVFCSAELGPRSTAAGCLQSLKLPLRPTPVTCHLSQEYNIEHRHSRHRGQTLLDWKIICLIDIISPAAGYLLIAKTVQNFLQTCHLLITSQHMLPLRGWVITGIVRSPVQEECDDGV